MSQSRPQTILFADVSGSTRLFETKGDLEARRLIAAVLDALSIVCVQHGGRVIKTIGDEIMCTLPTALAGVMAACDMQRKMSRDLEFLRENLAVRIGFHHGNALDENDDVFGDAVNVAARMTSLAKREQIVTTAMTMVQSTIRMGDATAAVGARLTLRHRGRVIELTENSEPFMMGREATNGLQVEADWVSRTHSQIEYKRGHFVITDRSTNATYVTVGQEPELRLHRDELHLRGQGTVSMGQAAAANAQDLIHFKVE